MRIAILLVFILGLGCRARHGTSDPKSGGDGNIGSMPRLDAYCARVISQLMLLNEDDLQQVCEHELFEGFEGSREMIRNIMPREERVGDRPVLVNAQPSGVQLIILKQLYGHWFRAHFRTYLQDRNPNRYVADHVALTIEDIEKARDVAALRSATKIFATLFFLARPLSDEQLTNLVTELTPLTGWERIESLLLSATLHPHALLALN